MRNFKYGPSYAHRKAGDGGLTLDELHKVVPSAFADEAHESRSNRYAYIDSEATITGLLDKGFVAVEAGQQRVNDATRRGFTKHMIKFRHPDMARATELGGLIPELALINSHDGTSAYKLYTALMRLICLNGMVCDTGGGLSVSVQHTGKAADNIIDAAFTIVDAAPKLLTTAKEWSQILLPAPAKEALAIGGAALRWNYDAETHNVEAPVDPRGLLKPRRFGDYGDNLFNVFNVVQENLIKGGVYGGYQRNDNTGKSRKVTSRGVNGLNADVKLNVDLWRLASEIAAYADTVSPVNVLTALPIFQERTAARIAHADARARHADIEDADFEDVQAAA